MNSYICLIQSNQFNSILIKYLQQVPLNSGRFLLLHATASIVILNQQYIKLFLFLVRVMFFASAELLCATYNFMKLHMSEIRRNQGPSVPQNQKVLSNKLETLKPFLFLVWVMLFCVCRVTRCYLEACFHQLPSTSLRGSKGIH